MEKMRSGGSWRGLRAGRREEAKSVKVLKHGRAADTGHQRG